MDSVLGLCASDYAVGEVENRVHVESRRRLRGRNWNGYIALEPIKSALEADTGVLW